MAEDIYFLLPRFLFTDETGGGSTLREHAEKEDHGERVVASAQTVIAQQQQWQDRVQV